MTHFSDAMRSRSEPLPMSSVTISTARTPSPIARTATPMIITTLGWCSRVMSATSLTKQSTVAEAALDGATRETLTATLLLRNVPT